MYTLILMFSGSLGATTIAAISIGGFASEKDAETAGEKAASELSDADGRVKVKFSVVKN